MSGSTRSRLQMYLLVTLVCGASAVLVELLLASTSDMRGYANRQISSVVSKAVRAEVPQVTQSSGQR